jgi:hypothetical protein
VTARQAYQQAEQKGFEVISIGITNQRETMLIWERDTLAVIYPAIVWQDRRTAELRKALKNAGHEEMVTQETGLLLDPYFSASKVYWILHEVENPTTTTTLSLAGALPNHFTTSTTFNKLFDGDIIYSTNSDKRIHHDSDDNLDFTLTGTALVGTVFDVYWDNEQSGSDGIIVRFSNDGVIALFDTNDLSTQLFSGIFIAPENTDGEDVPDFLDTNSEADAVDDYRWHR